MFNDNGIIQIAGETKDKFDNSLKSETDKMSELTSEYANSMLLIQEEVEVEPAEGAIVFGNLEWVTGKASVTITKITQENVQIQYKVIDEEGNIIKDYAIIESGNSVSDLNLGEIVNARLWNGVKGGSSATLTVNDVDAPNEAEISFSSTSTNTVSSITATVKQSDGESGVDISSCKYVYNTNPEKEIDESEYIHTFTSETQNLSLKATTVGTYYLHVLTVDNAGNKTQTVSEVGVNVIISVTKVSLNKTTARIGEILQLTATVEPSNATNKQIKWSSSNSKVLTVDQNGKVTRVSDTVETTVTITASATDGSGKKATCTIEVYPIVTTITYTDHENQTAVDKLGNIVEVPGGYKVHADTSNLVAGGIVITDGTNEFVWVPVDDITDIYDETNNAGQLWDFGTYASPKNPAEKRTYPSTQNSGYREPDVVTNASSGSSSSSGSEYDNVSTNLNNAGFSTTSSNNNLDKSSDGKVTASDFKIQLQNEFNEMIESVEIYGGFYIGRYETGNLSEDTAVVQKNNTDINNQTWYTMYKLSKTIATNDNVVSSMIWGCQWDATLRWMQNDGLTEEVRNFPTNSDGKGNYTGTQGDVDKVIATGSNSDYEVNKIFDMAGNVMDWTIEAYSTWRRTIRGGSYNSTVSVRPANCRTDTYPTFSGTNTGSRATLYVVP